MNAARSRWSQWRSCRRSAGAAWVASHGSVHQVRAGALEVAVVALDAVGLAGQDVEDERLDVAVLVLGVEIEEVDQPGDLAGEVGHRQGVGRVRAGGGGDRREQLHADRLVDVAVEVEGDRDQARDGGVGVGDRHASDDAG